MGVMFGVEFDDGWFVLSDPNLVVEAVTALPS
jgi:hypothetical protein